MSTMEKRRSVLVLDTCEEQASLALFEGALLREQRFLPERKASSSLVLAVQELLDGHAVNAADLECVAVVNGPGSFTGVRIGLAFAKGFCLATGVPLVTVSRLAVLADRARVQHGLALASAGRAAVYARVVGGLHSGEERMVGVLEVRQMLDTLGDRAEVICASNAVAEAINVPQSTKRVVPIAAADAFPLLMERRSGRENELDHADANYVRDEQAIYRNSQQANTP